MKMEKFIQIPHSILFDTRISDEAYKTYCVLYSFKIGDNPTFPSLASISKKRGRCRNSISLHLQELKKLGFINYQKRGYSKSNEYYFNFPVHKENGEKEEDAIPVGNDSFSQPVVTSCPNTPDPNNINGNINTKDMKVCTQEEMELHKSEIRNQHYWLKHKNNVKVIIK